MPFNLNNVDVTVAANAIYGITAGSIYNVNEFGSAFLQSDDMQMIYLNTTKFVAWAIKSNFSERPDLAQVVLLIYKYFLIIWFDIQKSLKVYYPSKFNFLWYASRTLFLLENEFQKFEKSNEIKQIKDSNRFNSLKDVLEEAKFYLKDAFEGVVSDLLIKSVNREESINDEAYFCDFLGLNDTNILGKPTSTKCDCLFSTAQAINILISTWTYQEPDSKKLVWKPLVPQSIPKLMDNNVNWLKRNVLSNKYKAFNAFFSGSVKGLTSLPFWYPSNFIQFLNGTNVTEPEDLKSNLESVISGVNGLF